MSSMAAMIRSFSSCLDATRILRSTAIGTTAPDLPLLFRQMRPGLHGKPFEILKFRTMRDAVDADGRPLLDDERLTRLECLLRSTSLDELPELWNALKGEMSLVGPRPLLMRYLDRFTPEEARRDRSSRRV